MVEVREWGRSDTAGFLRVPGPRDDKYSRGVVAVGTGSAEYPGAAVLSVEAAWRAGAGYVRYTGSAGTAVLARRPETVATGDIGRTRADAWVIGSGTDAATRTDAETDALRTILSGQTPVVVDAGALDLVVGAAAPVLVTPHAGEFASLRERLRLPPGSADRIADASETAAAIGGTVLLKGARTVIASSDGAVIVLPEAPGWLATAGSGDVLAGILGTMLASNPAAPLAEAAASGAWLHAYAARLAAGMTHGMPGRPIVALDVAEALPQAIADLLS